MMNERVANRPTEDLGDLVLVGGVLGLALGQWLGSPAMGILIGLVTGVAADAVAEVRRMKGHGGP
jgi:F0F1-type ATP synthase assembly protein I